MSVKLLSSGGGSVTIADPASTASNFTLNPPLANDTLAVLGAQTFTGQQTIPTINLTGGQIKFPATQGSSSDANTLDDYEEGTFTAYLSDGTNSVSLGTANYIKVGAKVTVWSDTGYAVSVTALTATTSQLRITGLPFSSTKTSHSPAIIYYNNSGLNYFFGMPVGTVVYFEQSNNVVDANATTRALLGTPNNMTVFLNHTYYAA